MNPLKKTLSLLLCVLLLVSLMACGRAADRKKQLIQNMHDVQVVHEALREENAQLKAELEALLRALDEKNQEAASAAASQP